MNIKFLDNPSRGAELFERANMTKLLDTFRNLAKRPKKVRERVAYNELQTVSYRSLAVEV